MELKGDASLLGKLDLEAGAKAASKAISNLESTMGSDVEAKSDAKLNADAKADIKAEGEACPSGKIEMPNGQLPNGPITIIDAHRSVQTESPLTAQLAQSVTLLNRLLLTMMSGGMAMPAGVAPNMLP